MAGVREAIRALGASVLYLPLDNPDLNAIEQLIAKLKAMLWSAAAGPHSLHDQRPRD